MCLNLSKLGFIPRIALTNIKCYKVIQKRKVTFYRPEGYYTPYQDYKIDIGTTYTSKLDREGYTVNMGLHSFKNIKDAFGWIDESKGFYVAECIIPRGSLYYKGRFFSKDSYASNKLTYLKLLDNVFDSIKRN